MYDLITRDHLINFLMYTCTMHFFLMYSLMVSILHWLLCYMNLYTRDLQVRLISRKVISFLLTISYCLNVVYRDLSGRWLACNANKSWCFVVFVITSPNGNIFRVTGPLWRECTSHRWISNYICSFICDVFINPCPNFEVKTWWVITSHIKLWI